MDLLVVERGLAESRQRAQALILAGKVTVDRRPATKAGTLIDESAELGLLGDDLPYVSRGGLKLERALDEFALDVRGALALDVGASTGGFTDCLLQRGARHVVAVDVGYGQLAWKLRQDERVTVLERTNARYLTAAKLRDALPEQLARAFDLAVIDVAFISLRLVLPAVVGCLAPNAPIVALIKPQFEAQREQLGKGGVIRDPQLRRAIIDGVLEWAVSHGLSVVATTDSPIAGPKGNLEHLALLRTA